ncbi:hypothetical protein [Streptomyces sp. NPDC004267]|uniref:hypothetical protein n=1 Tax=Streptomyces sp. NPDC004267 TaxID=3364694 RepID=UPI003692C1C3
MRLLAPDAGRICLDGWELDGQIQQRVRELWAADPETGLLKARSGADRFLSRAPTAAMSS